MPESHASPKRDRIQTLFNLEALAAEQSGATPAEREVASQKAERLRVKLRDRDRPATVAGFDLLNWQPRPARRAQILARFGREQARACVVVRDVLRATLGVETTLRTFRDGSSELLAGIDTKSATALKKSLSDLVEKIESYWAAYLAKDALGGTPDGLAFFAGLTDGIIGDGRQGGVVPGRFVHKRVRGRGKRTDGKATRAFTLHPYEVGHAAGSMTRLEIPEDRIKAFLTSAAEMLPE